MLFSLCAYLYDASGDFIFDAANGSDFSVVARRLSRTATLDGGALIVDNGYTPSDATFNIILANIDQSTRDQLARLVKLHSLLICSTATGCYLGSVETMRESSVITIRFLVKEQLSE